MNMQKKSGPNNNGRRSFIKGGAMAAMAVGAAGLWPHSARAKRRREIEYSPAPGTARYWLTDVILESGFIYKGQTVSGTRTTPASLLIDNGKISKVAYSEPDNDGLPRYSMGGALALPSFADMHIHLDKGNYGNPWKAATAFVSVEERIKEEREFLPGFVADTPRKAKALLDLITSYGVTFMRVQCNVDPVIKLQNVEKVIEALEAYSDKVEYEMVAFPQHGTITKGVPELLSQSLSKGCSFIGGVDPATLDKDLKRSLATTMELAVKHQVPIDLHLHNWGKNGTDTIRELARLTEQAKWQNRVTISHAYCLGQIEESECSELLDALRVSGIDLLSSAPISGPMPPAPKVAAAGVTMQLGQDCINDNWSSFGSGSIIERASRLAEINDWDDEYHLNRSLKYIARGKTPLDDSGRMIWPKEGDAADIALVDASCSAELIARRNDIVAVLKKGRPSVWKV